MKLTKDQIDQLKQLISHKGYTAIDVQYEILDHVACKIEQLMEQDPKLSLEAAFTKVHASFGIFGFSGLEESYEKSIQQKATKFTLEALVTIWTSWRIILPFGLTALFLGLAFINQLFLGNTYTGSYLFAVGIFLILLQLITVRSWRRLRNYHQYAAVKQSSPFAVLLYIGLYIAYILLWHSNEIQWWNIASMGKDHWISISIVFITFSLLLSIRKSIDHSIERAHMLQRLYETA